MRALECSPPWPSKPWGRKRTRIAQLVPFGLAADQKLVDDHLCAVGEIAELGFPDGQAVRGLDGVAVLETKDCRFGQHAVENPEMRSSGLYRGEGQVHGAVFHVIEGCMALAEGSAPGILPGKADGETFVEKGGKSPGLRRWPSR